MIFGGERLSAELGGYEVSFFSFLVRFILRNMGLCVFCIRLGNIS